MRKRIILLLILGLLSVVFTFWTQPVWQGAAEGSVTIYLPLIKNGDCIVYLPLVQWTKPIAVNEWIGPDGGNIVNLVVDPSNPQVMYAGTFGAGVFKSLDRGRTWTQSSIGIGNLYINSLAIAPNAPNILYAGSYKGMVYKTVDAGATWFPASLGIQDQAVNYSIVVHPQNPDMAMVGTRGQSNPLDPYSPPWNGVVYVTRNGGESWYPSLDWIGNVWNEPLVQDWVYSLLVDPFDPQIVYAASHQTGPLRTSDFGDSWKFIRAGVGDYSSRAFAANPLTLGKVYMGTWSTYGLYRTLNRGDNWGIGYPQDYFPLLGNAKIYQIGMNPQYPSEIYLATYSRGVIKTNNDGQSWFLSGLFDTPLYSVLVNPPEVFVGSVGDGLYRSEDSGATWVRSQSGLQNATITGIVVQPDWDGLLFTSLDGGGVKYAEQHGRNWVDASNGLITKIVNALVAHPTDTDRMYALTDSAGLFRWDMAEGFWRQLVVGLPAPILLETEPSGYSPEHPFAGHQSLEWSFDPPTQPDPQSPDLNYASLFSLGFQPSNPSIMYLGTQNQGIYLSLDGGLSWRQKGLLSRSVHAVVCVGESTAYAAATATTSPGGVFLTTDYGNNWTHIGLGHLSVYVLYKDSEDRIWAGTSDGVYLMADGVWVPMGLSGLPITVLAQHPVDPAYWLAGTTQGAYVSSTSGISWDQTLPELDGRTIQSIAIDPDSSYIYFGVKAFGIYRVSLTP